jgi:hypothetical protein
MEIITESADEYGSYYIKLIFNIAASAILDSCQSRF